MFSVEVCKALQTMGYPQDKRPQMCLVDYGSGYGSVQPYYAQDDLMPFGQPWVACPSELEALDWLEDEHLDHWRYGRDEDGLWYVQNGYKPTRKAYREIGRFRTPVELILAISEDYQQRHENTR